MTKLEIVGLKLVFCCLIQVSEIGKKLILFQIEKGFVTVTIFLKAAKIWIKFGLSTFPNSDLILSWFYPDMWQNSFDTFG